MFQQTRPERERQAEVNKIESLAKPEEDRLEAFDTEVNVSLCIKLNIDTHTSNLFQFHSIQFNSV